MYERDGHTDTQTPHDGIGHACKAPRGKWRKAASSPSSLIFFKLLDQSKYKERRLLVATEQHDEDSEST